VANFLDVPGPAANKAVRGGPRSVSGDVLGFDRHRAPTEDDVEETLFERDLRHE